MKKNSRKPAVSIFIPTGNRGRSLAKTLASLSKQTYKDFEVIVVDYRSTDNTHQVLAKYSKALRIRVINQEIKGLARASNIALSNAQAPLFIRTDDDIVADPTWIAQVIQTFADNKRVGGVTGPTVIPQSYIKNRDLFIFEKKMRSGSLFWRSIGSLYFQYFLEGNSRKVAHWFRSGAFSLGSNFAHSKKVPEQIVTNLEPCNFALRTHLARQSGGFDETYDGVGEYCEADLAFKIQALGYCLTYNPQASVQHCPSRDGFFNDRPDAASRMSNFMVFYLRHIKPDTIDKMARFLSYLLFLNLYYFSLAIRQKNARQLGSVRGTIRGIMRHYRTRTSPSFTMNKTAEIVHPIVDTRGKLVLFLQNDQIVGSLKFGQLYFVTFEKKGVTRGNHYHKKCDEWFGIVTGRVKVILENIKTHEQTVHILDAKDEEYVRLHVAPEMAHTIVALSAGAILISYANRQWTPDDTYVYQIK